MRPVIEFCAGNTHHGTEEIMKQLEQNVNYDVVEYGCLGNCGECYMFPYALVNGESVAGETSEQLMEQIKLKIVEIEQLD